MRLHTIAGLAVCLGVNALAAAATLKGIVENGTTGKPAAGDVVVLWSVGKTPTEIGRAKTDAGGRFQFEAADLQARHLVRVVHQGVAYDKIAPAGVNSVEVQVLDVARALEGVTVTWDSQRLQTAGDTLQVVEEVGLRNTSNPPRTLIYDPPFEIQLPTEAEVVGGKVQISGGRPFMRKPTPTGQKGRYYFPFALPPGESRFAVAYRLPYRGEALIEPTILYPLERFVVAIPKSMRFEGKSPGTFQPMPGETWANVQHAVAVKPGQLLAFRISGTGTLAAHQGETQPVQAESGAGARPARPSPLPGPPQNDRWFILGCLALVLAAGIGGLFAHKRKQPRHLSAA